MTRQTNYDPRWARHGESFVVVADGGRARIFKRLGGRHAPQLLELEQLERPTAHMHARDLTTDLTGRMFNASPRTSFGPRSVLRNGAQSDYDPHAVEVERFARRLAARLTDLARQTRLEELVLIAEPRFLGVLRRELPEPLLQLVSRELARNLTSALAEPIAQAAFSLPAARPSGSA